jgi:hypothetical protein
MQELFERGVVIVSIDTEQIWGYVDLCSEAQFQEQFPDAVAAHDKLLDRLRAAGVSATWFVVGGLAMPEIEIAGEGEATAQLWYRPLFVKRLRDVFPSQEIGLHGGLTHLIWTDEGNTREALSTEIDEGIKALGALSVKPCSFSFPRNQEVHHDLLPEYGIRCYRGRPGGLSWQLGRTLPGAFLRAMDEVFRTTPAAVWPEETLPGLWNIPASMFLYPIGAGRARILGLRSRAQRFRRGLEAAARSRGIFHFCFHPENLAESPHGFSILDDILDHLIRARERGDVEVMTMSDVLSRLERSQPYVSQKQTSYQDLSETHRRG